MICQSFVSITRNILLAVLTFVPMAIVCAQSAKIGAVGTAGSSTPGVWVMDQNGNYSLDGTSTDGYYLWTTGQPGEVPVVGDWNGDGRTKMGVYHDGTWLLDYNGNGVWDGPDVDKLAFIGGVGYVPVVGDWNGTGNSKIGAYNNGSGIFLIDYNGNFAWDGTSVDRSVYWSDGNTGNIPVIGDWNGTGFSKIGIFYQGLWLLDYDGNYAWNPPVDKVFVWTNGNKKDVPVVGNWNGLWNTAKIGVYDNGYWVVDYDGSFTWDQQADKTAFYGGSEFVPVVGDWNGDGKTRIAAYSILPPSAGAWVIDVNGNYTWDPPADVVTSFGGAGQIPVVGKWHLEYTATSLYDLQTKCLDVTTYSTCTLAAGTYAVDSATEAIKIWRYGVTLTGGSSARGATRLVRGSTFTGPLVQVAVTDKGKTLDGVTVSMAQASASQGVVIQNLTFCGGGNTWPNTTSEGHPAVMSPADQPCGDRHLAAPTACNYTDRQCTDISVDSVDSGSYPTTPFTTSGPYALELNNVDLEDAAGHALSLYATANNSPIGPIGLKRFVNDVWIHNSAINYSAITGILYGANFVRYDDAYCDQYKDHNFYEFRDDPSLFAPRNIRIESNDFKYNNTGAMGGGAVRYAGVRHNNFFVNYISPQAGNFGGGGIEFDGCADKVEISYNTITGPNSTTGAPTAPLTNYFFSQTDGLELYGRNLNVHDNTITGQSVDAIGAMSLFHGTIANNHVLQDNSWVHSLGGILVGTSFPQGGCDPVPRDTDTVTVSNNDSNPIDANYNTPLPTPPTPRPPTQGYGVELQDHGPRSSSRLNGVTVTADNFNGIYPLFGTRNNVFLDLWVGLYGYMGETAGTDYFRPENPRILPVDVTSASSSTSVFTTFWPIPPRCPDLKDKDGNLIKSLPPGSKMGSTRAKFKFSASDRGNANSRNGANNIAVIWGIFSVGGNDSDGAGGPSTLATAPDQGICNFMYDTVNDQIYLGNPSGGWYGPSRIGTGNGGVDLATPGGCIIHPSNSTSWASTGNPQAVPTEYVLDLTLDVTLPTPTPPYNKYHIYSWMENGDIPPLFDACGIQTPTCPSWKYSGYWWDVPVQ